MAFFDIPGWSVGAEPVAEPTSASKKRKRPSIESSETTATGSFKRPGQTEFNFDKIMNKFKAAKGNDEALSEKSGRTKGKKRKEKKGKEKPKDIKSRLISHPMPLQPMVRTSGSNLSLRPKKKVKFERKSSRDSHGSVSTMKSGKSSVAPSKKSMDEDDTAASPSKGPAKKLTTLQKSMKQSLDGARFRLINETLYKTDSSEAVQMMHDDPEVFKEYHVGFRHQVQSWPTNPVEHYISTLSHYPPKTTIADLGCGDAALARSLTPKGLNVLSFDLVSDGVYVIEADVCNKIPLPGSEPAEGGEKSEGEGQVVDVVVCALSLMGTNWPGCIREAWRILRPGGELKIAEVASRMTDIEAFVSLVTSIGFKLKSKDVSNTHFTTFEFKKVPKSRKEEKEWAKILAKGELLKPCEYKRR